MSDLFEENKRDCPWYYDGDCIGQPQLNWLSDRCEEDSCPFIYWKEAIQNGVKYV